jgi:diguanylate cyclase (GGDEF)-like protein
VRIVITGFEPTITDQLAAYAGDTALHWQHCASVDEARRLLQCGGYLAVVMDAAALGEQALSFAQELRHQYPNTPLLAVVGAAGPSGEALLAAGAADYASREELCSPLLSRLLRHLSALHKAGEQAGQLQQDPLTGVANRQLFLQVLQQSLTRARSQQSPLALLVINFDNFKNINDSFGYRAGDLLMRNMARRLTQCAAGQHAVARIGGDEFALIIERCQQREAAEQFARRLIDELSAPVMLDNYPVVVSVSIGAALYPEASDNAEGLLKRAVLAMRQAKLERGSSLQLYSEETKLESLQRLSLEADLRKALRRNEFELHYQPRVDLISGETLGMESLIRWRHPTRGWVSPQEFIPVAEESGLIIPIGYWTIKQACNDMNAFTKAGYGHLEVAVNLSFKQLQDSLFVETATRIIEQSGVDASQLEFELTETAIMSNFQQTYDGMMALAKLGITFSLDDFGTGFSSFAHIQKLPISALKIDRSFIRRVIENNDDAVIVRAIINLAHSLRLRVIGEGVETLEQVQFLWQHCCDQVQGYYFSPAIPAADFCRLVDQRATVTA